MASKKDKIKRYYHKFFPRDASKYDKNDAVAPLGSPTTSPNSNENNGRESNKTLWQHAYDGIDEELKKKYQRILDEACPNGNIIKSYYDGLNQQCFNDAQVLTINQIRKMKIPIDRSSMRP